MSNSGVAVDPACLTAYDRIKKIKDLSYITFRISDDDKTIIVDKQVPKGPEDMETAWNTLVEDLCEKKDIGRYCVFDANWKTDETGALKQKLIFISWIPDTIKIKKKMIYASSKDGIKKKLDGIAHHVQANDLGDLDFVTLMKDLKAKFSK